MIVSNGNVTITEAVWLEIVEDSKQRTDELNDRIRVLEAALGKIIERADKGRHEEDFDSIRILASDAYAPPQAETKGESG